MVEWIRLWTFKLENRVQSRWSYNFSLVLSPWKQSQYSFKNSIFFIKEISFKFLCGRFWKNLEKFAHEDIKKLHLKVAQNRPNSFSVHTTANRPKTSPNLNFFSIKNAHRATYDFAGKMATMYLSRLHIIFGRTG